MRRSRIGLLLSAVILVVIGSLPGVALADPTPSGQTNQHEMLSGVLHGEGIVQTKNGPVRVAMQNGTATAATETSLTVRSADGYTKTWTLAKNVKVFDKRQSLQPDALQAGTEVAVGGPITVNGGTATPAATPRTTYTAQIVLVQSAATKSAPAPSETAPSEPAPSEPAPSGS
jgi:hypothetical protein